MIKIKRGENLLSSKIRLDNLLVQKGLFPSRERAKAEIMAGNVFIDDKLVDKAGTMVDLNSNIVIKGKTIPYVSRGGLKLEKALKAFNIDVKDKVVLDAGASTGGFTDCLLKNGAKKVFAVDVGYGQLDYGLRQDERVIVFERQNVRYLTLEDIGEQVDLITADLSFISLSKVFKPFFEILKDSGELITLVKPQFEAGKDEVGKKGVIKDKEVHITTIEKVFRYANENGFYERDLTYSPITGPKGNIEFLAFFTKYPKEGAPVEVKKIVEAAHSELI